MGFLRITIILHLIYLTSCMDQLHLIHEWSSFIHNFDNPSEVASSVKGMKPEAYVPTSLAVDNETGRLFLAVPRLKSGVVSTINVLVGDTDDNRGKLAPYPSWKAAESLEVVSPFKIHIDNCRRLWALDSGKMNMLDETNSTQHPPAIVIYDLDSNTLLRRYQIPADQVKEDSLFTNIAVEDRDCLKTYAYAADTGKVPEEDIGCLKQKFMSCFKGCRLLKTLVICACLVIVAEQIAACIRKLIVVPITTYTHFDFNKTLTYPSVTFCKEPPYKFNKMLEYGLYAHPRWTSAWINYNFSNSLDDLWEDITYSKDEIFIQYGLQGLMENVEVTETIGFATGRCYTLSAKVLGTHASKTTGYSVTLRHTTEDMTNIIGTDPPGYRVYIHYTKEPFTEVEVYNGGLVQNLFINVGETMDVKLTVDEYLMISDDDNPCTFVKDYSANKCTAQHVWDVVGSQVGCSGPWMSSEYPHCDNFTLMTSLISDYMNKYIAPVSASCPRFCKSYMYNAYVMDRSSFYIWDDQQSKWLSLRTTEAALQTQMYIYFNSMMVSVYEERYNYDWNLFISDLGGSIGFLLGLSVIGLLKIVSKTWKQFIRPCFKSKKPSKSASIDSGDTTDVAAKFPSEEEGTNGIK